MFTYNHIINYLYYRLHAILTAFCLSSIDSISLKSAIKIILDNNFYPDPVETQTSMILLILSKFNKKFKEHKLFKFFMLFILLFLIIFNLPYLMSCPIII